jgi:hypothetical protein
MLSTMRAQKPAAREGGWRNEIAGSLLHGHEEVTDHRWLRLGLVAKDLPAVMDAFRIALVASSVDAEIWESRQLVFEF